MTLSIEHVRCSLILLMLLLLVGDSFDVAQEAGELEGDEGDVLLLILGSLIFFVNSLTV